MLATLTLFPRKTIFEFSLVPITSKFNFLRRVQKRRKRSRGFSQSSLSPVWQICTEFDTTRNLKPIERNKRDPALVKKIWIPAGRWRTAAAIDEKWRWKIHLCVLCAAHVGVGLLWASSTFGVQWLFLCDTAYQTKLCLLVSLQVWPKWLRIHFFFLIIFSSRITFRLITWVNEEEIGKCESVLIFSIKYLFS